MNKKPIVTIFAALSMQLATAQRPNIIVILADDMGCSDLGCFGSEWNFTTCTPTAMNRQTTIRSFQKNDKKHA